MSNLRQRIAYLQGLAAGLAGREEGPHLAWWQEVSGLLEEMAGELEDLREEQEELREFVDALDQSLGELEDDFYETEEEDEDVDRVLMCPGCGEELGEVEAVEAGAGEGEGFECPHCGETIFDEN